MRAGADKIAMQNGEMGGNMKFGESNVGEIDKAARAVLGILFLCTYVGNYVAQPWAYAALVLGLAMVATAAYGSCLIYSLLGISTNSAKGKKK